MDQDRSDENTVRIRGRVGDDPVARELPSGAQIVTFRVVISREQTVMTRGSRQRSDWVDCTAWSSDNRRRAVTWRSGDVVEVDGALRRRHYRSADSGGSRLDIEMLGGRRVSKVTVRLPRVAPVEAAP